MANTFRDVQKLFKQYANELAEDDGMYYFYEMDSDLEPEDADWLVEFIEADLKPKVLSPDNEHKIVSMMEMFPYTKVENYEEKVSLRSVYKSLYKLVRSLYDY
jgi:hypothetical protein